MGGLRRLMPVTFVTYAIGMMTLSGVPLFFSGGWTKEEILHATAHWPRSPLPYYLMMAGVVLTALYMTRQMIYVFFGNPREAAKQAHESPSSMTVPLVVLAACSIALSIVLTPAWPWLHGYLTGESGSPEQFEIGKLFQPMLFVSLALVAAGIGLGILIYRRSGESDPLARVQPFLFRFLENKMWLDELYAKTILAGSALLSRGSDWMDRHVWDGLVRAVGGAGQFLGILSADFDERGINAGVDESAMGARGLGRFMSARHSGQIQTYMGVLALGMLALLILYAWLT
jgi:NADH-quinone oxidoreductase subunit L